MLFKAYGPFEIPLLEGNNGRVIDMKKIDSQFWAKHGAMTHWRATCEPSDGAAISKSPMPIQSTALAWHTIRSTLRTRCGSMRALANSRNSAVTLCATATRMANTPAA